jgi:hypothetical protein
MTEAELQDVVPMVTAWVCTSPPGTGTVQVDAVRSPSAVQLVIATPWPHTMQSRLWPVVSGLIDQAWIRLHGSREILGMAEDETAIKATSTRASRRASGTRTRRAGSR